MESKVEQGQIVFRRWDDHEGLSETIKSFNSLDELFSLCLQTRDPLLVDRVYIQGKDGKGQAQKLTLVFQSITVSEGQD